MKHRQLRVNLSSLLLFLLFLGNQLWADLEYCTLDMGDYQRSWGCLDELVPQPFYIKQFIITADIEADDLEQFSRGLSGKSVSSQDLKELIFYLAQKQKFNTVHISHDPYKQTLTCTLESYWTFDRLAIGGILLNKNSFKRIYLLHAGQRFDEDKHAYSCQLIARELANQGYYNALVHSKIEKSSAQKTVKVTLAITRNKLFKISSCQLADTSTAVLLSANKNLEIMVGTSYNQQLLEKKIDDIRTELHKAGYYPKSFELTKTINREQNFIDIQVNVELSARRIFIFEGNHYFTSPELFDHLLLFGNAAWALELEILTEHIGELYKQKGFNHAHITAGQKGIQCVFNIQEGLQMAFTPKKNQSLNPLAGDSNPQKASLSTLTFGNTIIQNNSTLPAWMIARELAYNAGDPLSQPRVRESIANLKELEIFDEVYLHPIANPWRTGEQTMVVSVHEDDPHELRLRLGVGLQQMSKEFTFKSVSYVAGGAYLYKNPFGFADRFYLNADYTYGEQTLSASYVRPWIFGLPLKSVLELYATQYLQPGFRHNQKNIYSFIQQGCMLELSHKRDFFTAQLNTGFEWMETRMAHRHESPIITAEISRALNFEPLLLDHKIPYAVWEPNIIWNQLDDPLNPTTGQLSILSLKTMVPWRFLSRNSFFLRLFFDQAIYRPLYGSVLALRARAGHVFYENFKNVMPAERFYLGGANSIRSYETDMCPPLGTLVNDHGTTVFVPQGARSMFAFNAEVRIPVYKNIWVALFQDIGALSNNHFADISPHHILAGTGFGIRYNTSMGPLRFDIAWKWHRPDRAIPGYCWFLSFGNAF